MMWLPWTVLWALDILHHMTFCGVRSEKPWTADSGPFCGLRCGISEDILSDDTM